MRAGAGSLYGSSPLAPGQRGGGGDRSAPGEVRSTGRSLVVLPGGGQNMPAPTRWTKPSAVFVAQLIATKLDAPQTRARRRAEPGDAQAVYAATTAGCGRIGRALCRTS
jgi:hypothetical protein